MKAFLYGTTLLFLFLFNPIAYSQYSIVNITDATNGQCNGVINVFADPVDAPHTFLWSDDSTDKEADDLCPGTYTVTITASSGCTYVLEGTVGGTGCLLANITIPADIVHYCDPKNPGEINVRMTGGGKYTYVWSDKTTLQSLTNLTPGKYCVTVTDENEAGCEGTTCYDILDRNCGGGVKDPVVIINEVSNGPGGNEEFVEVLVVGDGSCNAVNIGGYILDDNDGTFSTREMGGTGIAPGHIRFAANHKTWSAVPVGALILIYNAQNKNPAIKLQDDPEDADGDRVYVLPSNHEYLETNALYPKTSHPSDYNIKGGERAYTKGGDWRALGLYEYADAIQVRKPDGTYSHGVSYGIKELMKGGPDELLLTASNGIGKVFAFQDGDYKTAGNYLVASSYKGTETPGFANNARNAGYISALCGKKKVGDSFNTLITVEGSAVFHPNPFNENINIELDWQTAANVQIRLYDLLGKVVIEEPLALVKGYNQYNLNIPTNIPSGLYHITICQNDEVLIGQKIICAKTGR